MSPSVYTKECGLFFLSSESHLGMEPTLSFCACSCTFIWKMDHQHTRDKKATKDTRGGEVKRRD